MSRSTRIISLGAAALLASNAALGATEPVSASVGEWAPLGASRASISLLEAQTLGAWEAWGDFGRARGSSAAMGELLARRAGTEEHAFAVLRGGADGVPTEIQLAPMRSFFFTAAAEGVASARSVSGPPVLRSSWLMSGILNAGLGTGAKSEGLSTRASFTVGGGNERRIEAGLAELGGSTGTGSFPVRGGWFLVYGLEGEGEYRWALPAGFAIATGLGWRGTWFETALDPRIHFAPRWKARVAGESSMHWGALGNVLVGLEGILGPQPLPVEALPRSWDLAHPPQALPGSGDWVSLRKMAGLGLYWKSRWARVSALTLRGGNYGGHWGGSLGLELSGVTLSFASWGFLLDSVDTALPVRLMQGSVTVVF